MSGISELTLLEWVVLALILGGARVALTKAAAAFALGRRSGANHRQENAQRRNGWLYGYAQGYSDASNGYPFAAQPPEDGRRRTQGAS